MSDKKKIAKKAFYSIGGLVLILVILILINLVFAKISWRYDITDEKLYSLSNGTKKILSNLQNNVTVKFFYTQEAEVMPEYLKIYAKRLLDFLYEYEYYSNGKLKLEVFNPTPDSEVEEWAQKYRIKGVPLPTGDKIYFGLVIISGDNEETIEFLEPAKEERLEYDLTRIVSNVQTLGKKKIGLISSLDIFGSPKMPYPMPNQPPQAKQWYFIDALKSMYDVSKIEVSAEKINDDIDLLLVVFPRNLSAKLQFAIDQYILSGKNAMIFVDPYCMVDNSRGSKASNLPKLFSKWGIKFNALKAVADLNYLTKLRGQNNQIEDNLLWLSISANAINRKDIITSKLESMLLPVVGEIEKDKDSKLTFETLIESSTESMLTDSRTVPYISGKLRGSFTPSNKKYNLAVKLNGIFESAFDKAPDEKNVDHIKKAKASSTVIIVGDVDMLFDNFYMRKQNFFGTQIASVFNDNLNFLLNATEMLSGSSELINIRSRGKFQRPFTHVKQIEKQAQDKWLVQEQTLVKEIEETNQKLNQLELQKDSNQNFILSKEQESEIIKFQEKRRTINKQLKIVRRNLRKDIESLGNTIKVINIFLMPFLVCVIGILFAIYKKKRS